MVVAAEGGGGNVTDGAVDSTLSSSSSSMTMAPISMGSMTATTTVCKSGTATEEGDWSSVNGTGDGSWLLSQNDLFVLVVLEVVATPMWREEEREGGHSID